jgi:hypothetical protein
LPKGGNGDIVTRGSHETQVDAVLHKLFPFSTVLRFTFLGGNNMGQCADPSGVPGGGQDKEGHFPGNTKPGQANKQNWQLRTSRSDSRTRTFE